MTESEANTGERRAATFDLMFVFAITQITHLIETMEGVTDLIAVLAVLLFLWWMYGGFVWLASNTKSIPRLGLVLLTAMLGFFFLATGIPGLHEGGSWLAGDAAIFVVLVHAVGFMAIAADAPAHAMLRVGAVNLTFALLILISGVVPHGMAWIPQCLMIVGLVGMATLYAAEAFDLLPEHFVERYGLLLIVVLGESIIAVSAGLGRHPGMAALLEAGLVIVLVIALWLSRFTQDDGRSEAVLHPASPERRGRMALIAYWSAFAIMIGGILAPAAGVKLHFLGHTTTPEAWIAMALAFYFAGIALFRWEFGLPRVASRRVGTVLALAIWPMTNAVAAPVHAATDVVEHAEPSAPALAPLLLAIAVVLYQPR